MTVRRPVRIDVSTAAIVRVLAAVTIVWLWLRLWQWILLLVAAAFLAVGLDPAVTWLERHRVRRGYAAMLVVFSLALLIGGFGYFAGAELIVQSQMLGDRLNEVQREVTGMLPKAILDLLPQSNEGGSSSQVGSYLVSLGRSLFSGLLSIGVAFILALYLLVDGRRTLEWLVAFAPRPMRPRVWTTLGEARTAVAAYVRGNAITSALAAVVAYVFLIALKVPAALLLALLTGLLDFVPIIGIFLSALPMVLLAFTVSTWVGIATAIFNVVYNVVENYYISPRVYGNEMRLSDLAVILAFGVGAELGGVVGALIALPIVAMYPAVERIWLRDRLGDAAVDHRQIEQSEEH
jgi:predicted PurR-regulated permease PerM